MKPPTLLYCHCQHAQVLPKPVKEAVLKHLCESGQPFEAVPDLCELSARRDPVLRRLATAGPVKIAACFPRAVKWLFAAAAAPLDGEHTEVVNLRQVAAEDACASLLSQSMTPNLPSGQPRAEDAPPTQQPSADS